jgi:alpha-tubulin suppressor-like RCC1 family protein
VVAVYDGAAASAAVTVGTGEWAQVFAGGEQSCGLTRGGKVYCWGSNHVGQIGNALVPAAGTLTPVEIGGGRTYRQLSVSGLVGCALTGAGAAYCWGYNASGQLGIGTTANVLEPRPVSGGHTWATISVGNVNVCGITTAGKAYCWGNGDTGALGDSTLNSRYVPMPVSGGHTFAQIDAGGRHTCALKADGEAWCWGKDHFGQLGVNSVEQDDFAGPIVTYPVRVAGGLRFRQISADGNNTCGVTLAGKAYCWGQASQTGTDAGHHTHRRVPTAVAPHLTFAAVHPSTFESCGLTTDGSLYCWGYYRPLATETADAQGFVPDRVPTPFRVADLQGAPFNHVCVTATTGVAYCGGINTGGKVGNGTTENTTVLVKAQDPR